MSGTDVLATMAREIKVPLDQVTDVSVTTRSTARRELGWRVGGTFLPGLVTAGWYTVRGADGRRQWWAVYRDNDVLVVNTSIKRPARIVIQSADRDALCEQLRSEISNR